MRQGRGLPGFAYLGYYWKADVADGSRGLLRHVGEEAEDERSEGRQAVGVAFLVKERSAR